jgi:hypothetical protein
MGDNDVIIDPKQDKRMLIKLISSEFLGWLQTALYSRCPLPCKYHADSTPVSPLSANSVQIPPPDQKVTNEIIRYKQAKGRLLQPRFHDYPTKIMYVNFGFISRELFDMFSIGSASARHF